MKLVRKVGQTKFIIDGYKGLLTLHDGGTIAASGNHKFVFDKNLNGEDGGYFIISKPTIEERTDIFNKLFKGNKSKFISDDVIVSRGDKYLDFKITGLNGFFRFHDNKDISLTKSYDFILKSIDLSKEKNKHILGDVIKISSPKVKTCKLLIDSIFNSKSKKETHVLHKDIENKKPITKSIKIIHEPIRYFDNIPQEFHTALAHLEKHGSLTEKFLVNTLGSDSSAGRKSRRFANKLSEWLKDLPFDVYIEQTAEGKAYRKK